jgi:GNAT superfamily N-acetyltransferase
MRKKGKPTDLRKVKTRSVRKRRSKVDRSVLARLPLPDGTLREFFDCLPKVLRAEDLLRVAERIARAAKSGRGVIWMMGGHVVKCGLSPLVNDLIGRDVVSCVAMNGAAAIHDFELAFFGETSEDVAEGLRDGSFGMARETAELVNQITVEASRRGKGLGEALGETMAREKPPHGDLSILIRCFQEHIPATVHVAIGTDVIHQHPSADGAAIGAASLQDFRILAGQVPFLNDGGVVINCGSAVIMPEVFLKALTVARNVGNTVGHFTAVNLDMIQHYRPNVNVLERPIGTGGGEAFALTGHHEIMIPLLYSAILSRL